MPQLPEIQFPKILTPGEQTVALQEREARALTLQSAVEKRQAEIQAARQAKEEQAWLTQAARQYTHDDGSPDLKTIAKVAWAFSPGLAQRLDTHVGTIAKQAIDARKTELENEALEMADGLRLLGFVTDQHSLDIIRPSLANVPALAQLVPDRYDQAQIDQIKEGGLKETDRINKYKDLADLAGSDAAMAFQQHVALARTQDDLDDAYAFARTFLPREAVQGFQQVYGPQWTPEVPARAQAMMADAEKTGVPVVIETSAGPQLLDKTTSTTRPILNAAGQVVRARPTAPVVIQTGAGPQIVDRSTGQARPVFDAQGNVIAQAPTAEMRNRERVKDMATRSVDAIRALSQKVITKRGVAQRATAAGRSVESALGKDPEYRTYQDARMALAGNLAVLQQGSRPSDADIRAIWLPMVPDVFADTDESAGMKWGLIYTMSGLEPPETRGKTAEAPADLVYDPKTKTFKKAGGG